MNPYTSLWTGATGGDGPEEFHLVLLDAGRTRVLADEVGRAALHCIRCSARLNVRPVFPRIAAWRTATVHGLVCLGPIGADPDPQLIGVENAPTLPFATSLCGACYDACPVKIDIPTVLLHLRSKVVRATGDRRERLLMASLCWVFRGRRRFELAQRLARLGQRPFVRGSSIGRLPPPLSGWTRTRDLRPVGPTSLREWWKERK